MKLIYVCEWNKIKEKTWSGTTYFLYNSLKKKIDTKEIDLKFNFIQKVIIKLLNIFKFGKCTNEFSAIKLAFYERNLRKKLKKINNNSTVIQIGDYGICNNDTYVYQDLSIDSLIYYKNNKNNLFKFSGYDQISDTDMIRRRDIQMKFYKNSKGIFTMSKWLAKNLIEYSQISSEKVHYVGAGINIDRNKIKEVEKTGNKILFVGRDFFRKGGDITYDAFKILKSKYMTNAELYIAGPTVWPLNEKCEGVNFLGDLSYEELSEYFNKCDIFCLPSRFEAYGLVFAEALVYGLPCIGRNDFAMNEFIKEGYNGYLIEDDDIEQFALKMYKLLNNNIIKDNVVKNREKYINKYSWDSVTDRILRIIEKS